MYIFFDIHFLYLCRKPKIMAQLKTEGIYIRMSPKLRKLFLALKDHKGMSQTNLIEHLVRSEADKCGVVVKEEKKKEE